MATPSAASMFEPEVVSELRRQFDTLDKDSKGELNAAEACNLFARNCIPDGTEEEIRKMSDNLRNQIDRDGSGTISFDEYCLRFGRRCQMELRKRSTSTTSTPCVDADADHSASDAAAELRHEREAAAREREALQREREALRREREEMNRLRTSADQTPPEQNGGTSHTFAPGTRVAVRGLQSSPGLNGKIGSVIRFDASNGRYIVQLEGEGQKSFKADNLSTDTPSGVSTFLKKVKSTFSQGLANVTVWLAGYEWWQIALGVALIFIVVGAWWQQSARYSNQAARNSGYRRAASSFEDDYSYTHSDYGEHRHRADAADFDYENDYGSDFGGRRPGHRHAHRQQHRPPHYEDYDYGYDAGPGYSGGGGGGGMFGDNGQLYTLLILGGLGYACWKGIIPVHQMSWFQIYMLWNMIQPLLTGGRGGYGGGYRRRRGFMF